MKKYLIKDLMNVNRGSSPRPIIEYLSDSGYRWLKISDFNMYDRYVYDTKEFIKESGLKSTKYLSAGTLILTNSATPGIPIFLGRDMCLHDGFLYFTKIKENIININFLYYWFLYNRKLIVNQANGSVFKNLKKEIVENFELKIPKMDIQLKIVKILDNINKKIELNNKINNNLYDISKQLLLKYLAENSNSEEINISELLNVFTGKKNANETTPTGKYKFFSCAPESLLSDTYLYDGAAIIVAGNGAYTGRTRFYDGKFELYQRTYGLILKEGLNKNNIYGLYVFMKNIFEPDKMGGTHGSAIPYIVLSDLTNYRLKYNKKEFNKFSNLVSYNIKIIQENEKSNEQLEQLRDTLLPKLMNGEIDLDNIEI